MFAMMSCCAPGVFFAAHCSMATVMALEILRMDILQFLSGVAPNPFEVESQNLPGILTMMSCCVPGVLFVACCSMATVTALEILSMSILKSVSCIAPEVFEMKS